MLIVVMAIMLDRTTTAASERAEKAGPRRASTRGCGGSCWPSAARRSASLHLPLAHLRLGRREFPESDVGAETRRPRSTASSTWFTDTFRRADHRRFKDIVTTVLLNPMQSLLAESPWYVTAVALATSPSCSAAAGALDLDGGLPGRHLVPRPVARRDGHADHDAGRHPDGDGPRRWSSGSGWAAAPLGRPGHPAAPRRGPDHAAVRLPGPGAGPVRADPVHRDRRGDRLRRAGRHQAGRRRHPGRLADHGRGRRVRRCTTLADDHQGPAADGRGRRSCSRPTRACSTCCRWSSSAAWSAPARSATTSSPASRSARSCRARAGRRYRDRAARRHARPDHPGAPAAARRRAARRSSIHAGRRTSASKRNERDTTDDAQRIGAHGLAGAGGVARRSCWRCGGGGDIESRPSTSATRRSGDCGDVNMAVNPWVGYEADAYVVGAGRRDELGCTVELQGPQGGVSWQGFGTGEVDVIIENWGHPDLKKKYYHRAGRRQRVGRRADRQRGHHRLVRAAVDGQGVPRHHRLEEPQQVRRRCSRPPSPAARASSSTATRRYVTNDEALVKNLKPRTSRWSTPAARPR